MGLLSLRRSILAVRKAIKLAKQRQFHLGSVVHLLEGLRSHSSLEQLEHVEPVIHEIDYQDKPQTIAFSGVWDFPFGKGRSYGAGIQNPVLNGLISNWTFDWIFSYYSGYPTTWPELVLDTSVPGLQMNIAFEKVDSFQRAI